MTLLIAISLAVSVVAHLDTSKPPTEIFKLKPAKLTLNAALSADLDADGCVEWVLVCTYSAESDAQMQEQYNQVVVGVFKKVRSSWESKGWKEAGSNFTSMKLVQADGGRTKEIAVFCYYAGGDFGVKTADVFGFDDKGFRHLGQGGGCNGGVEIADYDADGMAEIKGWSELWRRELNHAEVHEHITDVQRVRGDKYVSCKAYLYDSKKMRSYPLKPSQAALMLKNRG